jgi:putative ABC transport system substrate-binding protein
VRRRQFITLLGGAAAWPLAARAQRPARPVVGFVEPSGPSPERRSEAAFRQGLKETGFIEGQNVTVEYRYGENQPDRLREHVADLVRRNVAAIASIGGVGTAQIVKAATSTIPVIFEVGSDPAQNGLVTSLSRPGGNLTGVNSVIGELWPKQIDVMAKLLPSSRLFGVLPTGRLPVERQPWQQAADAIGRKVVVATALTPQEFEPAFAALARQGAEALIIGASPLSYDQGAQLAALAARYSLPAIYAFREIPKAGGLMSYGIDIDESLRLVGLYTGRVLKGEKPADLPVVQPTRFVLAINLKTAKALGLTVPTSLLAIADEVIE